MYEYIPYVLANYFFAESETSEKEAIALLREHFSSNADFACGLKGELQRALSQKDYPWPEVLATNDVAFFGDEKEAMAYAIAILWEPFFGKLS